MNLPSGDETPPITPGLYLIYTDPDLDVPFAKRTLMMWTAEKRWGYLSSDQYFRGHVYGWFGPIPAMKLVNELPPVTQAQG